MIEHLLIFAIGAAWGIFATSAVWYMVERER